MKRTRPTVAETMTKYMDNPCQEALESMVWQFAYRVTKAKRLALSSGGLSALEEAFGVLGWDEPHYVQNKDCKCEVIGCYNWLAAGEIWEGLYLLVCSHHWHDSVTGKPRPPIEMWALKREAKRDPVTRSLPVEGKP